MYLVFCSCGLNFKEFSGKKKRIHGVLPNLWLIFFPALEEINENSRRRGIVQGC